MPAPTDTPPPIYPCDFPIKAMGKTMGKQPNALEEIVMTIIKKHTNGIKETTLQSRSSSGGKYQSITITIIAESRQQLDAIYHDLNAHDEILMTL